MGWVNAYKSGSLSSPGQSVTMMFSQKSEGAFSPPKALIILNSNPGPISREQRNLVGYSWEPFWASEGPAVAMVSALAPLRLVPAGVVQVSISRSCLAAVDVARGCQPPRGSGAADGGVGVGSVVASLFSRLISHFERVPACVLHSVEHSIWLQCDPDGSIHSPTWCLVFSTVTMMKDQKIS